MLSLKKLVEGALDTVPFDIVIDAVGASDDIVSGHTRAKGDITNHSGFIALDGAAEPKIEVTCARCGKVFEYSKPFSLYAKITDRLANDDEEEFVLMSDYAIDIEELVRSALVLELPTRFLCREDCKGLCQKCGADLNVAPCSCDNKEHDPRWDALLGYFDEE